MGNDVRPSPPGPVADGRWERRPVLAFVVKAVVLLAPAVLATDVSLVMGRFLPEPHGILASAGWWVAVLSVSGAALFGFDRLFRRLLPLTALLDLALVFPGVAPSRFSAAFRAGTIRSLQSRIEEAKHDADRGDAARAAATVVELIAALAVHDPKTRGHSERTRAYAELIAEELALPAGDRDRLRWSALLHDIGKLHVSSGLLNKSTKPDAEEWEQLRQHPVEGARIAGALRQWLGPWGLAIEQHHERFDGGGYPKGLVGHEISLAGRIVAVADAFEVMTSARTYTPPVPPAAAREELVRCAGGHFDPEIVRAFLRIAIGRFPRRAGILVALGPLPGFLGLEQVVQQAGSALVTGAAVAALAVGGVVVPGAPGIGDEAGRAQGDFRSSGPSGATTSVGSRSRLGGPGTTTTLDNAAPTASPNSVLEPQPGPTPAATEPATETTAAEPVAGGGYHLSGAQSGEPPSPAPLTVSAPAGEGATDHDGDGVPGRTLRPTPRPATTIEPAEHQLWSLTFSQPARITGVPRLTIPSTSSEGRRGTLRAYLLDCDSAGRSCVKQPLASGSTGEAPWNRGTDDFVVRAITFSRVDHTIEAGRALVLRLGVPNGSAPLRVAYGTSSHDAFLAVDRS